MPAHLTPALRLVRTIPSLGCAALLALALPAAADDRLPVAGRSIPSVYEWSGLYLGGHVGYSRGKAQTTLTDLDTAPDSFGTPFSSATGGIQLGYNYVLPSRILLGVEADAAFMNYLAADDVAWSRTTVVADTAEKVDYMASLRGRLPQRRSAEVEFPVSALQHVAPVFPADLRIWRRTGNR